MAYVNYALVFTFFLFSLAKLDMHVALAGNEAPTLFMFGDSVFDVGTNNFLNTKAKANFPYYGIDFHDSLPTGRFSNGFNTADQIARQFGYEQSPPAFLATKKNQHSFNDILQGLNFASAGSGILQQTGSLQWGEVVFLEKQVEQFASVRESITQELGPENATTFISKALFVISAGSNDLFEFARNDSGAIHFGKEGYLVVLRHSYDLNLRKLYELGARKFGILGPASIGCCPALSSGNGGNCVTALNDFAVEFYSLTRDFLPNLSAELEGFKYSLVNTSKITATLLESPSAHGLNDTKSACCGIGYLNAEGPCMKAQKANLCTNRKDHLFWDLVHPTEIVSEFVAKTLFGGGQEFVTPINFSQLAFSS
ncbi:GDSL esterase/lipase At5g55050-like [Abrus precatorius]|uniref:GDSL esterase/lipase At5g55050-like n=1 Tax=Abrus precatorius TaxID=3816 RepID=A0A8B8L022_ABRPR|nr:GDSL esterase/lipase At5g55050-like [Abrus precatorius]